MNDRYEHLKRGTRYEVLHYHALREADMVECVVYCAVADGKIWVRPRSEFFDGRFVPITDDD